MERFAYIIFALLLAVLIWLIYIGVSIISTQSNQQPIAIEELQKITALTNDQNTDELRKFQSEVTVTNWRDNINASAAICAKYSQLSWLDFDVYQEGFAYNQCRLSLQIAQNAIQN